MAGFESKIHRLRIEPHPNADRLELAAVGGYRCVVAKDSFKDGDLAAYIPEGALCPDWLIAELGLEGRLSGSKKNRVKAVKLRGALSQGLVYPVKDGMLRGSPAGEGDVVTDRLELVKYEPPIPGAMQGQVRTAHGATLSYDIENVKKYPDELSDGEQVVMTEKLHGTWCCLGHHPEHGAVVTSKGLSARGLVFMTGDGDNPDNVYVRAYREHAAALDTVRNRLAPEGGAVYVLGEVYGRGVQDLHYNEQNPRFRAFDVYVGEPGSGRYLNPDEMTAALDGAMATVPEVYSGPFSEAAMLEATDGTTTLGGGHVREGVVVRPAAERRSLELGRVILKSVSGRYLTRKGGTEYE